MLLLTVCVVIVYTRQCGQMQTASQQTTDLIKAANIQACAAQKIADASNRNAESAQQIADASDRNADAAESFAASAAIQATAAGQQVESTRNQLDLQQQITIAEREGIPANLRAFGFPVITDPPFNPKMLKIGAEFQNDGSKEAIKIEVCTRIEFKQPTSDLNESNCKPFLPAQRSPLRAFATSNDLAIVPHADTRGIPPYFDIENGTVYVHGVVRYIDTFTHARIPARFCYTISMKVVMDYTRRTGGYFAKYPANCPQPPTP